MQGSCACGVGKQLRAFAGYANSKTCCQLNVAQDNAGTMVCRSVINTYIANRCATRTDTISTKYGITASMKFSWTILVAESPGRSDQELVTICASSDKGSSAFVEQCGNSLSQPPKLGNQSQIARLMAAARWM
eukprot:GHRR01033933.1.p3 GENE.GHRR01033933.1~~GHRR01033933.1.p3  ORF type:complete len:133 (-),score=27.52 GHRR01033933.1:636-1034(-)